MLNSFEYENVNLQRYYPFYSPTDSTFEKNWIVDMVAFISDPVYITSISDNILIVNNYLKIILDKSKNIYSDKYVKIMYTNDIFGHELTFTNVRLLNSLCYPSKQIKLQNLSGDIDFNNNNLEISLPETPNFTYDCITTINNQNYEDYKIGNDVCTQITPYNGLLYITDKCKPPCYGCNERLAEGGDLYTTYQSLVTRIEALEQTVMNKYFVQSIVIPITKDYIGEIQSIGTILRAIVMSITVPFDGDYQIRISPYFGYIAPIDSAYYIYENVSNVTIEVTGTATVGEGTIALEILKKKL